MANATVSNRPDLFSDPAACNAPSRQSILASLCEELRPSGELEHSLLEFAADALFRLRKANDALMRELETSGFTDHYFRLQSSEAKDRAALTAMLNQFHKLESRRIRQQEREEKQLSRLLDRAVSRPAAKAAAARAGACSGASQPEPSHNAFEVLFDELFRKLGRKNGQPPPES